MKTLQQALIEAKKVLHSAGVEEWEADARLLVQGVVDLSREQLFLQSSRALSESEALRLREVLQRRLAGEPVSRIFGRRWFWKFSFNISPETLDPRADSEVIVEAALKFCPPALKVLDLGTGTGCLLLSLLSEWPDAQGIGVDISAEAVSTARLNAQELGLSPRSSFILSDWNNLELIEKFDVIVSNPPYIAEGSVASLQREVASFDPLRALVGGVDGLDAYRALSSLVRSWLKPDGWLFFEIGYDQKESVTRLLEAEGWHVLQVLPDLAGNDRCVVARLV